MVRKWGEEQVYEERPGCQDPCAPVHTDPRSEREIGRLQRSPAGGLGLR